MSTTPGGVVCTGLGADTLTSIAYVDGLGRARAGLSTGDDTHPWVRGGMTTLDKKGTVRRTYQGDFYDGSDTDFRAVVALPADIPYAVVRYDAFGRARGVHAEDGSVTWTSSHSLSTDVCDPLDNDPSSEHYRTCTTTRTDGHGRVLDQELRNRDPGDLSPESYRLWSYYRADGAVLALVRAQSTGARPATWTSGLPTQNVVRTFFYDSVGRRLSSDDPDTDDRTNMDGASNSWRYLFNRVGDIVAVRDPRGCGQNFFYDLGGRLRGEQYVSCGEAQSQAAERPPSENEVSHLSAMTYSPGVVSLDVVYHYDAYPDWSLPYLPGGSGVLGRATGVTDRAQRAVLTYDDRGNVTWTARQMALISEELELSTPIAIVDGRPQQTEAPSPSGTVVYDETHTYSRTASFDHAGRPTSMTLPDDPDYGATPVPRIGGSLTYNRRGLPSSATAQIGADSQIIVDSIEYLRDGLVGSLTYGDDAGGRAPARSSTTYDIRRRPLRMTTTRTAIGTGALHHELDAVTTVLDQELVWDAANNLVATVDHRNPAEWPAGHRPQSTFIRQDALYRVVGAEFEYTQTDGSRTATDLGTDWRDEFRESATADPMRQEVPSMIVGQEASRVVSLTWDWDYLANTTEQTDDRHSFYERSIGSILNGDDVDDTRRPSALYLASNVSEGTGPNAGWVEVDYGLGGNVTAMTVHGQCVDAGSGCSDPGGSDLSARRAALRACSCDAEQHYVYRWDELNRLAEARRYDHDTMTAGAWQLKVRQRYRYDGSNQRTVKQTLDQDGCSEPPAGGTPCERIALYPYAGDFERRGLVRGFDAYEANAAVGTETQYLVAGARMVWRHRPPGELPLTAVYESENRLAVGFGDLIGTTSAVFDVRTRALLESSTYYPNGGRETFLNDDDTLTAPEPMGFPGKEADEDVGVVYFGERYLIPRLGRWASPDPLHVLVSGGGEALNSYHYVGGNLLAARDPEGLVAALLVAAAVVIVAAVAIYWAYSSVQEYRSLTRFDEGSRDALDSGHRARAALHRVDEPRRGESRTTYGQRLAEGLVRGERHQTNAARSIDRTSQETSASISGIDTAIGLPDLAGGAVGVAGAVVHLSQRRTMSLVQRYSELVNSNQWGRNGTSWVDVAEGLTDSQQRRIRRLARANGLVPDVHVERGTRYADFTRTSRGNMVIVELQLPENLWTESDDVQFRYLNGLIAGGQQAEGTVWHHHQDPGKMQLVPSGVHAATSHHGGRSPGHWAYRPEGR